MTQAEDLFLLILTAGPIICQITVVFIMILVLIARIMAGQKRSTGNSVYENFVVQKPWARIDVSNTYTTV